MPSLTRKVGSAMRPRLAVPAFVCLLLIVCVTAVRAEQAPAGGVRLPAGAILEQRDPRLALPRPAALHSNAQDKNQSPAANSEQGPPAPGGAGDAANSAGQVTTSAPAGGAQNPIQTNPESRMIIHRKPASRSMARAGEEREVPRPAGLGYWSLWDALPLAVVLALIAGLGLVVKKYMPAKRMLTGAGVLDIVARLPMSGKQSLVLVRMGRRLVLVGVSPEQISSLSVVEDPDQVAAIVGEAARGRPDSISHAFEKALGDEAGAYAETTEGPDAAARAGGSVRSLLEKVRRFTKKQQVV